MQMILLRAPRRNVLFAAVAGVIGSGCFGYYQPSTADLEGRRIQLSLTDAGSPLLAPQLGPSVADVEGILNDDSAGVLAVSVLGITRRDGQENSWRGERVPIPRTVVNSITERRFSRARTVLFVTASAIGIAATKRAFGSGGGSNAPGPSPGQPPGGK
jgi:hypothetical protein